MGECAEKERDLTCLQLVGSPCQNSQVMAHSVCWHSHASSLTGPCTSSLESLGRWLYLWKMEVPATDSGHPGTKVLTLVWTSKGEEDTGMPRVRASGEAPHEC